MKSILFAFAVAALFSMSAIADEAKSVAACCGKEQCVCKSSKHGSATNKVCDAAAKSSECPMAKQAAQKKACCETPAPETK